MDNQPMIWETLLGGAVGGLVGGPLGMALGAVMGAGMDIARDRDLPPLNAQIQTLPSADGITLIAQAPESPEGCLAELNARDINGNFLPARVRRFSRERAFSILSSVSAGTVKMFVPYGVIDARGEVTLSLRIYSGRELASIDVLGEDQLTLPWPDSPYHAARFWRPLLLLGMAVSRADGHIDAVEIQRIRMRIASGLKIPPAEADILVSILNEPPAPLPQLVAELRLRAPATPASAVLSALQDIARADGEVHSDEIAVIGEIGVLLQA